MESLECSIDLDADVISIAKTNENFRLLYDSKGRFTLHHINADEAKVFAALLISLLCSNVLLAFPSMWRILSFSVTYTN
jgi:hypothetical protein